MLNGSIFSRLSDRFNFVRPLITVADELSAGETKFQMEDDTLSCNTENAGGKHYDPVTTKQINIVYMCVG